MFALNPIILGILLGTTAMIVLGIIYVLLRSAPQTFNSNSQTSASNWNVSSGTSHNEDAFLIVQSGGKILHGNDLIYDW